MTLMVTVNDKGSIGVARIISDLLAHGYYVFLPFDGASPVDVVVAGADMAMRRLQVKYRKFNRWGSIEIPLVSVVNGRRIPIDISKIDGWAVFCPETDRCYYISADDCWTKGSLILSMAENRGSKRFACDYTSPSTFWKVKPTGSAGAC